MVTLKNFERIKIEFQDLKTFKMPSMDRFILEVNNNGVNFEFLFKINKSAKDLLILGSGAYDPNKMSPPVFQRHAWIDDFEETIIIYNDPTLYLGKITIGWGQGTEHRHYLQEQSQILEYIIGILEYEKESVYFYGSSAGGYMALMLSGFIKGTTALVNNPQTLVMNFWPVPVRDMLNASYPNLSKEEVEERFIHKINIVEFYKKISYVPPIHYIQNISATRDVEKHLVPFIDGLKELSEESFSTRLNLSLYANEDQGHKPLNKKETLAFINSVIQSKKSLL